MKLIIKLWNAICYRCAGNPEGGCRDCGVRS